MASGTAASVKLCATGLQRPRGLTVKIELMSVCGPKAKKLGTLRRPDLCKTCALRRKPRLLDAGRPICIRYYRHRYRSSLRSRLEIPGWSNFRWSALTTRCRGRALGPIARRSPKSCGSRSSAERHRRGERQAPLHDVTCGSRGGSSGPRPRAFGRAPRDRPGSAVARSTARAAPWFRRAARSRPPARVDHVTTTWFDGRCISDSCRLAAAYKSAAWANIGSSQLKPKPRYREINAC